MPGLRRIGVGIAALALAALSASHALGRINERKQPAIAVGTVPTNGTSLAEMAERILAGSVEQANATTPKLNSAQSAEVASLSRKAFALEPLLVTALRNLALVAEAEGDVAKARTLMRDAASLSRRDFWTQTWLLSDYAKQGDLTNSLAAFDRTLRTSSSGQSRMLPAMFNMLARPDLVEPLTMLLLKRPPWADAFWREAPKHPAGLANAAAIRAELARQGIPGDENQNRALMSALAAAEEFAAADLLFSALAGEPPEGAQALRNHDFDRTPGFAPFDWTTRFDSSMSTDLVRSEGTLRISTFSSGSGLAASQLLQLDPGIYTLRASLSEWDAADEDALYVRLRCAKGGSGLDSGAVRISQAEFSQQLAFPQSDCRYYWFEIHAAPQADRRDNTVVIDSISLERAGPRA
jgi:hypothetical protein